jgi:hypothetical protein
MITAPTTLTYNSPIMGGSVVISGSGSMLTAVLSGGDAGGFDCTLMITATGDNATVPMQTCDTTIMGIPVAITFASGGTVSLSGSTLTAMATITASGVDGGLAVMGTGTLAASCTKM